MSFSPMNYYINQLQTQRKHFETSDYEPFIHVSNRNEIIRPINFIKPKKKKMLSLDERERQTFVDRILINRIEKSCNFGTIRSTESKFTYIPETFKLDDDNKISLNKPESMSNDFDLLKSKNLILKLPPKLDQMKQSKILYNRKSVEKVFSETETMQISKGHKQINQVMENPEIPFTYNETFHTNNDFIKLLNKYITRNTDYILIVEKFANFNKQRNSSGDLGVQSSPATSNSNRNLYKIKGSKKNEALNDRANKTQITVNRFYQNICDCTTQLIPKITNNSDMCEETSSLNEFLNYHEKFDFDSYDKSFNKSSVFIYFVEIKNETNMKSNRNKNTMESNEGKDQISNQSLLRSSSGKERKKQSICKTKHVTASNLGNQPFTLNVIEKLKTNNMGLDDSRNVGLPSLLNKLNNVGDETKENITFKNTTSFPLIKDCIKHYNPSLPVSIPQVNQKERKREHIDIPISSNQSQDDLHLNSVIEILVKYVDRLLNSEMNKCLNINEMDVRKLMEFRSNMINLRTVKDSDKDCFSKCLEHDCMGIFNSPVSSDIPDKKFLENVSKKTSIINNIYEFLDQENIETVNKIAEIINNFKFKTSANIPILSDQGNFKKLEDFDILYKSETCMSEPKRELHLFNNYISSLRDIDERLDPIQPLQEISINIETINNELLSNNRIKVVTEVSHVNYVLQNPRLKYNKLNKSKFTTDSINQVEGDERRLIESISIVKNVNTIIKVNSGLNKKLQYPDSEDHIIIDKTHELHNDENDIFQQKLSVVSLLSDKKEVVKGIAEPNILKADEKPDRFSHPSSQPNSLPLNSTYGSDKVMNNAHLPLLAVEKISEPKENVSKHSAGLDGILPTESNLHEQPDISQSETYHSVNGSFQRISIKNSPSTLSIQVNKRSTKNLNKEDSSINDVFYDSLSTSNMIFESGAPFSRFDRRMYSNDPFNYNRISESVQILEESKSLPLRNVEVLQNVSLGHEASYNLTTNTTTSDDSKGIILTSTIEKFPIHENVTMTPDNERSLRKEDAKLIKSQQNKLSKDKSLYFISNNVRKSLKEEGFESIMTDFHKEQAFNSSIIDKSTIIISTSNNLKKENVQRSRSSIEIAEVIKNPIQNVRNSDKDKIQMKKKLLNEHFLLDKDMKTNPSIEKVSVLTDLHINKRKIFSKYSNYEIKTDSVDLNQTLKPKLENQKVQNTLLLPTRTSYMRSSDMSETSLSSRMKEKKFIENLRTINTKDDDGDDDDDDKIIYTSNIGLIFQGRKNIFYYLNKNFFENLSKSNLPSNNLPEINEIKGKNEIPLKLCTDHNNRMIPNQLDGLESSPGKDLPENKDDFMALNIKIKKNESAENTFNFNINRMNSKDYQENELQNPKNRTNDVISTLDDEKYLSSPSILSKPKLQYFQKQNFPNRNSCGGLKSKDIINTTSGLGGTLSNRESKERILESQIPRKPLSITRKTESLSRGNLQVNKSEVKTITDLGSEINEDLFQLNIKLRLPSTNTVGENEVINHKTTPMKIGNLKIIERTSETFNIVERDLNITSQTGFIPVIENLESKGRISIKIDNWNSERISDENMDDERLSVANSEYLSEKSIASKNDVMVLENAISEKLDNLSVKSTEGKVVNGERISSESQSASFHNFTLKIVYFHYNTPILEGNVSVESSTSSTSDSRSSSISIHIPNLIGTTDNSFESVKISYKSTRTSQEEASVESLKYANEHEVSKRDEQDLKEINEHVDILKMEMIERVQSSKSS